jgi:hypothetical protein
MWYCRDIRGGILMKESLSKIEKACLIILVSVLLALLYKIIVHS